MKEISLSRSRELGGRVVYEALKVLAENGGEMRGKEVISAVEKRAAFDVLGFGAIRKDRIYSVEINAPFLFY